MLESIDRVNERAHDSVASTNRLQEAPSAPKAPRLGCAVIVSHEGKVLLGVRAKEPFRGKWVLPGGGVKFLETFRDAATREIEEEVGKHAPFDFPAVVAGSFVNRGAQLVVWDVVIPRLKYAR